MYSYILLAIYWLILLGVFGFYVVFSVHIRSFKTYSSYLVPVFRILILLTIVIASFGSYMILTGKNPELPSRTFDYNSNPRIDF